MLDIQSHSFRRLSEEGASGQAFDMALFLSRVWMYGTRMVRNPWRRSRLRGSPDATPTFSLRGDKEETWDSQVRVVPGADGARYRKSWSFAPYVAPESHTDSLYKVVWMIRASSGSNRDFNADCYSGMSDPVPRGKEGRRTLTTESAFVIGS